MRRRGRLGATVDGEFVADRRGHAGDRGHPPEPKPTEADRRQERRSRDQRRRRRGHRDSGRDQHGNHGTRQQHRDTRREVDHSQRPRVRSLHLRLEPDYRSACFWVPIFTCIYYEYSAVILSSGGQQSTDKQRTKTNHVLTGHLTDRDDRPAIK